LGKLIKKILMHMQTHQVIMISLSAAVHGVRTQIRKSALPALKLPTREGGKCVQNPEGGVEIG
jgi:hypothetical protein